ncbi:MAG TPA: RsmE family RNA methyltransferase [Leptospiraceae bacterium]|nr:RsmE family RNA methyltransferase [Leptospiraceae bacterium]HMW06349.1 RsmE family RNA methyltransferase [Leptospiraceae bacterium]HMX30972.1 RsmE family RNA methyltransferase [Leptospiraceae bacterium]HMY32209.1 RsmE family RNA methyltransferase [Leptospiraceae bacterium]HMZ63790.1 RsmE family RNA methyltransferase [Leptospiraceae bacterium]
MILFRTDEKFTNQITFTKEEIEHFRSLRINDEEKEIEIRDGKGSSYFFQVGAKSKTGNLIRTETHLINSNKIGVASAIPKSNRLDFLLQKSTEIGITHFYFINFLHSERKEINLDRANKIILEACSQSKRHTIPTIEVYSSLEKFLLAEKNIFLLDPKAKKNLKTNSDWSSIPIIGPEGGFRKEELDLLIQANARSFSIQENILRIETAHVFMTSLLSFQSLSG